MPGGEDTLSGMPETSPEFKAWMRRWLRLIKPRWDYQHSQQEDSTDFWMPVMPYVWIDGLKELDSFRENRDILLFVKEETTRIYKEAGKPEPGIIIWPPMPSHATPEGRAGGNADHRGEVMIFMTPQAKYGWYMLRTGWEDSI